MTEQQGWLTRLRSGLARSSEKVTGGIAALFTKRKLDEKALEELEETLIAADLGPATAARLVADFSKTRFGKDVTDGEVRQALAGQIEKILAPCAVPLAVRADRKPFVVLMVGVNGTGKTTTIGKMAHFYAAQGLKVMMAAGDTFRAAAVSQLQVWGERTGCPVVASAPGGDPAALAFEAVERAQAQGADLLFIDTAGRLHNKNELMQELAKIVRVIKKKMPDAPHATLLVLDATVGQNAHAQADTFRTLADITGLVVTKLDGSAKGGVLVGLADRLKLPVHAIGVGEGIDDLRPFEALGFARALMGVTSVSPEC